MTRVKRGVTAHRRHRKMVKAAKGYKIMRSTHFTHAKNAFMKAGKNSYVGRKRKKRDFRRLWIVRINAALREQGIKYSRFIAAAFDKDVTINRKMLADLAMNNPEAFKAVVDVVRG